MRFEVPQFIDVEDKIFGSLTFKQFIYLAGGAALAYVSYKLIPFPFYLVFIIAFVGLGLLLAFYTLNNRTFIELAQSFLTYQIKGKLYIWKRTLATSTKTPVEIPKPPVVAPKPFDGKIVADLAQNLDILDQ